VREPSTAPVRDSPLLEREADLAALDRALSDADAGDGHVLLVQGPPGIGKSSLLGELRRRARARGLTVLTARGGEVEQGVGFGIVRQLLGAVASGRAASHQELFAGAAHLAEPVFSPTTSVQDDGDTAYAILHGLYWLVANLAERSPLLLSVDDVHWSDEPSVRFLLHLAYRLAGMPVLVVLATRAGTEHRRPELRPLLLEARTPVIRPLPLPVAAVERLVADALGAEAAAALCGPCHEATGGNPFLLSELLGELRREGRPAHEIKPDSVRKLGPERIAAALLLRVGQLDASAPALARAVAVLGEQARSVTCAQLAGLDHRLARELADELSSLAVLERGEPLRFVHPIVRTAIYEDISATQRAELHARAARILTGAHADPEQVAAHLMATDPSGDPEVVSELRNAARHALVGGAPDTATMLLQRALDEPPDERDRPSIRFELGNAEHELGRSTARDHLLEAARATDDPLLRARALIKLAVDTQPDPTRQRAQLELYEHAARDVLELDRELALQLHAVRLGALLFNLDLPARFEDDAAAYRDLPGETPAECLLLTFAARALLAAGESVELVGSLTERAVAHPAIHGHGVYFWLLNATMCLIEAERYDTAEQVLDRTLRRAEQAGSPRATARTVWLRGLVRHARGDLRGAEVDGRTVLEWDSPNTSVRAAIACVPVVESLTDMGRFDEGEGLLAEHGLDGDLPPIIPMSLILLARARLRAASGDREAARTDLEELLRRNVAFRGLSPLIGFAAPLALVPIRHALGDVAGARALADQTLGAVSEARSRRATGAALRVAGLVTGGRNGLELLQRAVDTLRSSPTLLWRAEALVDLGTALRRQRSRTAACDVLREGLDIAHRCGAVPLADRAVAELRAAGARPRRRVATGADALTASERRIAEQAAAGMTNKQIAQALFVTLRTVEMHLSNVYVKLGITSREDLPAAFGRHRDNTSGDPSVATP
jgi:DNA-binding CsgD family transcriptional regulator